MPMRQCNTCLENNWAFEVIELEANGHLCQAVRATCKHCDYTVEFLTKKGRRMAEGWIPPAPTTGTHAPGYTPIKHGPGEGDDPNDVPWYGSRAEMLSDEATEKTSLLLSVKRSKKSMSRPATATVDQKHKTRLGTFRPGRVWSTH